jgi:phage gpG-like protein
VSASLTIQFTPQAEAALARVKAIPQKALKGIARGMDKANPNTAGVIQKNFLNFPREGPTQPTGLRHKTGHLFRSVRASKAVITGESVLSAIGSNVSYAGVHEFGFKGTVNVPAHSRKPGKTFLLGGKLVSQRTAGKFLTKSGAVRKRAKAVPVPVHESRGVLIEVKAHSMKMNLPARAPIRRGIAFNMAYTRSVVSEEVVKAIKGKGGAQ